MRYSKPVFMASGNDGPMWTRRRKHRFSLMPFFGLLGVALALIGAITVGLSIKERSAQAAGVVLDGWMQSTWNAGLTIIGKAPAVADKAAEKAGAAASKTGDALEAGAKAAQDELTS